MDIGVVLPQNEIGHDTAAVLAFARRADELGYSHLLAYDHVLGADRQVHDELDGPYGLEDSFREPFVLFGHLSAITSMSFATAILIAPQRQTALIAKQAAEVDLLSGGRLRLGCGIGWNRVEYEALGQAFAGRGDRLAEQVALLRALWTEEQVSMTVGGERVLAAGLAPLPIQRPIPIWIGALAPAALRRVGQLADGWFPMSFPGGGLDEAWGIVAEAAREAGRDPRHIGMEGQVPASSSDPARTAALAERWEAAGASHLSVNTLGQGLAGIDEHLAGIEAAARSLGVSPRR